MSLPIRRKDFDVAGFLAYVKDQGGEVGQPTNPYEVVRYRAHWRGTSRSSVHVVYAKDNGLLTFTAGSLGHYRAFLADAPMEVLPGTEVAAAQIPVQPIPTRKVPKCVVRRETLLKRDGGDCWFCGTHMGDDCTIEHLVPKSKGGANSLANYALAHQRCNADAADLPLVEKIAMRERLRAARASA